MLDVLREGNPCFPEPVPLASLAVVLFYCRPYNMFNHHTDHDYGADLSIDELHFL